MQRFAGLRRLSSEHHLGLVIARRLRVATRTLENWEQGRATPNAQAAALILMVRQYPDTFDKLRSLDSEAA